MTETLGLPAGYSDVHYNEVAQDLPLKCNGRSQPLPAPNPIFSYDKYSAYVSNKFKSEKKLRIRNKKRNQEVHCMEYYTDEVLKQELFTLYGIMEETNNKFKLLFENYKEERLGQIRGWIEEESAILPNDELPIEETLANCDLEDHDNSVHCGILEKSFQPEINSLKISVCKIPLTIDPFLLPRRKKTGKDFINEFLTQQRTLDGLTHFDPDINLPKIVVPPVCHRNFGPQLVERIVSIVRKYPTGIASKVLTKLLGKLYNNKLPFNYEGLMQKFGHQLCFAQEICSDYKEVLYYPKCLDGLIVTPMEMFGNIWHSIRIILQAKLGIVKLSKLLPLCCDVFGWAKIDVSVWGFDGEAHFVQFLIDYYGDNLNLIRESDIKRHGKQDNFYLITASNLQQQRLISSTGRRETKCKEIDSMSSQKTPGSKQTQSLPLDHQEQMRARNRNSKQIPPSHSPSQGPSNSMELQSQSQWKNFVKIGQSPSTTINNAFPTLNEVQTLNTKKPTKDRSVPQQPKSWNKLF